MIENNNNNKIIIDPGTVRSLTVVERDIASVTLAWSADSPFIEDVFESSFTFIITVSLLQEPDEVNSNYYYYCFCYFIATVLEFR